MDSSNGVIGAAALCFSAAAVLFVFCAFPLAGTRYPHRSSISDFRCQAILLCDGARLCIDNPRLSLFLCDWCARLCQGEFQDDGHGGCGLRRLYRRPEFVHAADGSLLDGGYSVRSDALAGGDSGLASGSSSGLSQRSGRWVLMRLRRSVGCAQCPSTGIVNLQTMNFYILSSNCFHRRRSCFSSVTAADAKFE